ncbi:MAG: hypothetical protein GY754_31610, partial [bacterium]|nr:hypothetical protein [bacterium]
MYTKRPIVESQPPQASDENQLHTGMSRVRVESVLLMAKYDTVFKERLLEERESALNGSG